MTRPPDFDLTTVEGIVRTVEAMGRASRYAESWTQAGHCHPGTSNANPCRQPACINRAVRYSHEWATEAAHHARRLQGVASIEGCPHNGNCACALFTRHDAAIGLYEKANKLKRAVARIELLEGIIREARTMALAGEWDEPMIAHALGTVFSCGECMDTKTSGERAEDGAPLVCTACQGGRRP